MSFRHTVSNASSASSSVSSPQQNKPQISPTTRTLDQHDHETSNGKSSKSSSPHLVANAHLPDVLQHRTNATLPPFQLSATTTSQQSKIHPSLQDPHPLARSTGALPRAGSEKILRAIQQQPTRGATSSGGIVPMRHQAQTPLLSFTTTSNRTLSPNDVGVVRPQLNALATTYARNTDSGSGSHPVGTSSNFGGGSGMSSGSGLLSMSTTAPSPSTQQNSAIGSRDLASSNSQNTTHHNNNYVSAQNGTSSSSIPRGGLRFSPSVQSAVILPPDMLNSVVESTPKDEDYQRSKEDDAEGDATNDNTHQNFDLHEQQHGVGHHSSNTTSPNADSFMVGSPTRSLRQRNAQQQHHHHPLLNHSPLGSALSVASGSPETASMMMASSHTPNSQQLLGRVGILPLRHRRSSHSGAAGMSVGPSSDDEGFIGATPTLKPDSTPSPPPPISDHPQPELYQHHQERHDLPTTTTRQQSEGSCNTSTSSSRPNSSSAHRLKRKNHQQHAPSHHHASQQTTTPQQVHHQIPTSSSSQPLSSFNNNHNNVVPTIGNAPNAAPSANAKMTTQPAESPSTTTNATTAKALTTELHHIQDAQVTLPSPLSQQQRHPQQPPHDLPLPQQQLPPPNPIVITPSSPTKACPLGAPLIVSPPNPHPTNSSHTISAAAATAQGDHHALHPTHPASSSSPMMSQQSSSPIIPQTATASSGGTVATAVPPPPQPYASTTASLPVMQPLSTDANTSPNHSPNASKVASPDASGFVSPTGALQGNNNPRHPNTSNSDSNQLLRFAGLEPNAVVALASGMRNVPSSNSLNEREQERSSHRLLSFYNATNGPTSAQGIGCVGSPYGSFGSLSSLNYFQSSQGPCVPALVPACIVDSVSRFESTDQVEESVRQLDEAQVRQTLTSILVAMREGLTMASSPHGSLHQLLGDSVLLHGSGSPLHPGGSQTAQPDAQTQVPVPEQHRQSVTRRALTPPSPRKSHEAGSNTMINENSTSTTTVSTIPTGKHIHRFQSGGNGPNPNHQGCGSTTSETPTTPTPNWSPQAAPTLEPNNVRSSTSSRPPHESLSEAPIGVPPRRRSPTSPQNMKLLSPQTIKSLMPISPAHTHGTNASSLNNSFARGTVSRGTTLNSPLSDSRLNPNFVPLPPASSPYDTAPITPMLGPQTASPPPQSRHSSNNESMVGQSAIERTRSPFQRDVQPVCFNLDHQSPVRHQPMGREESFLLGDDNKNVNCDTSDDDEEAPHPELCNVATIEEDVRGNITRINGYTVLDIIGKGRQSYVVTAVNDNDDTIVAIKIQRRGKEEHNVLSDSGNTAPSSSRIVGTSLLAPATASTSQLTTAPPLASSAATTQPPPSSTSTANAFLSHLPLNGNLLTPTLAKGLESPRQPPPPSVLLTRHSDESDDNDAVISKQFTATMQNSPPNHCSAPPPILLLRNDSSPSHTPRQSGEFGGTPQLLTPSATNNINHTNINHHHNHRASCASPSQASEGGGQFLSFEPVDEKDCKFLDSTYGGSLTNDPRMTLLSPQDLLASHNGTSGVGGGCFGGWNSISIHLPQVNHVSEDVYMRRMEQNRKEFEVLAKLRHPNIIKLYEIIADPKADHVFLVMQCVSEGPLLTIDDKEGTCIRIPIDIAAAYTAQLASALQFIQSKGVLHRDVKPDNILVDGRGTCYLTDFGCAKTFMAESRQAQEEDHGASSASAVAGPPDRSKYNNHNAATAEYPNALGAKKRSFICFGNGGTLAFWAPECWMKNMPEEGPAQDMWAFGVTIYCMVYGRLPFYHASSKLHEAMMELKETVPLPPLPDDMQQLVDSNPEMKGYWDALQQVMKGLLTVDPEKRMKAQEVRQVLRGCAALALSPIQSPRTWSA